MLGVEDSNAVDVLAIMEELRIFSCSFDDKLIMESDSSNAIAWVINDKVKPWKLHFFFNEIKALDSRLLVKFHHVVRLAHGLADSLANQGLIDLPQCFLCN